MSEYALTQEKYLTPKEQAQLEQLLTKHRFTDPRNTTMLLFMLKVGPRPKELLNLTWGDINDGRVFIRTLKNGRNRSIPLSKELMERLDALGPGNSTEHIFKIKSCQFRNIWVTFRPCKKKLHSLRHTFAVNLYRAASYDLRLVQLALGHKNLTTTSVYLEIELNETAFRKALARV